VGEATNAVPISLGTIREGFFHEHIGRRVLEYHDHFARRLAAVYVSGSVHRDEAIPGVSDLDMCYFITDAFAEADEQWIRRVREEFERESPGLGGTTRPRSVEILSRGLQPGADEDARVRSQAWGIRLGYDATLVYGSDLIKGLPVPPPARDWARRWFPDPRELTRYAAGLTNENNTDFDLPGEPALRLRKLARLSILGGAALLMARGRFRSFRGIEVISPLEKLFPQWAEFLEETRARHVELTDPSPAQIDAYLSRLVTWMDFVGAQLEAG
jgi:hypothetical protein